MTDDWTWSDRVVIAAYAVVLVILLALVVALGWEILQ